MRLSPPELSYLYTSLTSSPPLRTDLRSLTTYRPYSIQTNFLSTANGSTRITWGTGQQGGDIIIVLKAQIGDAVTLLPNVYGGKIEFDMEGEDDDTVLVIESLTSIIVPKKFSSYGVDLRTLTITETKAWHIWIDCIIISKDGPLPLDAISLGVRVTLQTSFLPHIILEDVPMDRTYEEQVSFMDVSGRIPFERVFQVDDDWDNARPLISRSDWWKIPIIVTANLVEKTIFFDALPSEVQVTMARYAIATVPLNSLSDRRKVIFCQSVGSTNGYGAGKGVELSDLQRMIQEALKVAKEVVEAADNEVEGFLK